MIFAEPALLRVRGRPDDAPRRSALVLGHDADLRRRSSRPSSASSGWAAAFWVAAVVSFGGVALSPRARAAFSGGCSATSSRVATAATWAAYSVAIAPLMRRYSPFRISSLVLALGWVPLALVGIPQTLEPDASSFG